MIIDCFGTLIEIMLSIYINQKFYKQRFSIKLYDLLFVFINVLLIPFIPESLPLINWFASQALYLFYSLYITADKKRGGLFLYILSFIFMLFSETLSAAILSPFEVITKSDYITLFGPATAFLLAFIIFKIPFIKYTYSKISSSKPVFKLIFIYAYIIFAIYMITYKFNISILFNNIYSIMFILSITIIVNICILYYDQNNYKKEQELLSYKKNLPIYETLINDIRSSQHEFSNRIQSIINLSVICDDYETLKDNLLKYSTDFSKPLQAYPLLTINMPLLAASIYSLAAKAYEKGINVQFDILSNNLKSNAPENVISDLAAILLQNAIEASSSGNEIYVLLSSDEKTKIEIRNQVDRRISPEELSSFFKQGYSTKNKSDSKKHGLGLYYLKKQIRKYNGNVTVNCSNFNDKNWVCIQVEI